MKKTLLLQIFAFVFILFSCKKNSVEQVETTEDLKDKQKELLSFSSVEAYFKALNKLDKMSYADLMLWKKENTSNSYFEYLASADREDENFDFAEISNLPTSYQIILNKHGQVKVGDSIYVYSKGSKYHIPFLKQNTYKKNDGSYELDKPEIIKSKYFINEVVPNESNRSRINLSTSQSSNSYEFEFLMNNDPNSKRKYIHRVQTVLDQWASGSGACGSVITYRTGVYVVMELRYWRPKGFLRPASWQVAGDSRARGWNLNYTTSLRGVSLPCSTIPEEIYTFSQNVQTDPAYVLAYYPEYPVQGTSDYSLAIGYVSGNTKQSATDLYWEIDLSGWITQVVIHDSPAHIWTTSGTPLY